MLATLANALPPVYTTVTATVVDSSGQVWHNGTWSTTFVPTPGRPPSSFNNNGSPISQPQQGMMDGLGVFTVSLDNNNVVAPAGSQWQFIICPNASSPCSTFNLAVSGLTDDISTQVTAQILVPFVQAQPNIQRAYSDAEANGGYGALYVNTTDNTIRQCTNVICSGSGWTVITVSTNNPIFTGTLTTGCVKFKANSSDDITVCPQTSSGHITANLPTVGGTIPASATLPIVLNATTGAISCPTCSTSGVSFPLLAPDSVLTAPSYSFNSQNTTGFYRDAGTGEIRFSYNSTDLMAWLHNLVKIGGVSTFCFTTGDAHDGCYQNLAVGGANQLIFSDSFSPGNELVTSDFYSAKQFNQSATSAFLTNGFEVTTPAAPAASHQVGYFKAGKGFCAEDSASVEYCTSTGTGGGAAILASTTNTSFINTSIPNSDTQVIRNIVTFPGSGCPCRADVSWWLYLSATNSGQDVAYVSDGLGNLWAAAETATPGSASGYGLNGSGMSPATYANGAVVAFVILMSSSHAANTTVHGAAQGPTTSAPASALQVSVITSQ